MKRLLISLLLIASPALAQSAANPFTGNADAIAQGKAVYDKNCTACHGANAGAGDRAPAIVNASATSMRGARSDAQLLAIVRGGIPGTAMPAWGTRLSSDEILKLGAYIHALRGTALDAPLPGDVAHGREVFFGKGNCTSCHMMEGRGGAIGPALDNIAAMRKAVAINNALTKVEHRVYGDGGVHLPMIPPMEYNPVHVVTKSGQALDGVMRNQDAWSVQFISMDGALHSFDRSELKSLVIKPDSIMPTDYDKRLSPDEFKDLMAFLTRQGTKPSAAGREAAE
jgi:cytochrome c oxidase cbb3-type subunit 3